MKNKIASELILVANQLNAKKIIGKFPPKAIDLNKLSDDFWELSISDACKQNAIHFNPKNMADIIFFLNMVGSDWNIKNK